MKQNLSSYGAGLVIALGLAGGAVAADTPSYTNQESVQARSQAREALPQRHETLQSQTQSQQRSMSRVRERSRFHEQNRMGGQGNSYGGGGSGRGR